MAAYRGLQGLLVSLLFVVALAKPPECEKAPPWSIQGRQPMDDAKGKQASRLELLLQHFKKYGMEDLEFIIVNSKQNSSLMLAHHLNDRVSFNVYQETEEDEVWNVLEGGKDDMYVYDRCGRLTYYIPFPLSIIHDNQPIVSGAVLATYFGSTCGDASCDEAAKKEIEEIAKEIEDSDYDIATEPTEADLNFTTIKENSFIDVNKSSHLSSKDVGYNEEHIHDRNETFDDLVDNSNINENKTQEESGILNKFYDFFWKYRDSNETSSNSTVDESLENEIISEFPVVNETKFNHLEANETIKYGVENDTETETQTSEPCLEADFTVCKNWSKRKLLHAQACCLSRQDGLSPSTDQRPDSCKRFGKKRCKKMQTILKCCLKTIMSEAPKEVTTEMATEVNHVVCCMPDGPHCYVSETSECDPGYARNIETSG